MRKVFRNIVAICVCICIIIPETKVFADEEVIAITPESSDVETPEELTEQREEMSEEMSEQQEETLEVTEGEVQEGKEELQEGASDGVVSEIGGQVLLAILFTPEEAELYKAALNDTLIKVQEDTKNEIYECVDGDREDYFEYRLEELQKINVDEMFEEQADGSIELEMPHRNAEVIIDGNEYRTDDEGYYLIEDEAEIESILEGENEIILADQNVEFAELEADLGENGENSEIKYEKTFSEFAEGIMNMSEKMQQAEGQVVQVFYAKKKVKEFFGAGVGRSMVYKDNNIVQCNKHDKDLKSIDAGQFAMGGSDCAVSVRLGILSPIILYPYSRYCVEEALDEGSQENIYCNGKSKMRNGTDKNGRINCSWFKGIGHSESFHTHADKGIAPTTSVGSWAATKHNAASKTISVMSSGKWEITNLPTWISVSPKSGAMGTHQVKISVKKSSSATKRTGTISIKNFYGTRKFTVTQPANPSAPTLSVSRTAWAPTYKAQTATAKITTNQSSWSASEAASWLSVTKSGKTLTIKTTANTGKTSRKATITVKAGSLSKTIKVTQGGSTLTVSRTAWAPTYKAQTATAKITTNQSSWSASEAASWLSVTKSGKTLTIKTTANTGKTSRKATITVKAGSLSKTIKVTQGGPTLTVSRTTWAPTYKAQTATATITTNQSSWSASEAASWLSVTKSGKTLTIKTTANTGKTSRKATITVKAGGLSKTITVTQGRK